MDTQQNHTKSLTLEMLECPLCAQLLWDPVVTSCGHTFCKSCILRGMDHDNKCPMCRAVIHITPGTSDTAHLLKLAEYGVCKLIQQIIVSSFPEQYQQREEEMKKELKEQEFRMPLFLLGELTLFPGMTLPLHVFEPRYRLMIRRCLEGSRRFGVVPSINGQLSHYGTAALIENHWMFPDGRSLVMTTGDKRFKRIGEPYVQVGNPNTPLTLQDGYYVTVVEYIFEEPLPQVKMLSWVLTGQDGTPEREAVEKKYQMVRQLFETKLAAGMNQIKEKYGDIPTGITEFSLFLPGVLPMKTDAKVRMLELTNTSARLDLLLSYLQEFEPSPSCIIS